MDRVVTRAKGRQVFFARLSCEWYRGAMTEFVIALQNILGTRLSQDPKELQYYGRDWTTYFEIKASAVAFPTTSEEVAQIVQLARKHKVGLVPSGGRTGLSGGACALHGEVVISFAKMDRILNFNPVDNSVEIDAGVVTETLQNFAREKGLQYPVDFAARGSSQMGGNIATNAGGIKVVRYGLTRDWVLGLEVVTGKGEILNLNRGLVKNATGFDLRHLFVGSEGVLGFITKALIKLAPQSRPTHVLLLASPSLPAVMQAFQIFRNRLTLNAYEMFSQVALEKVIEQKQFAAPFANPSPFYAVVEVEASSESEMEKISEAFEAAMEEGFITDGLISQSEEQAKQFWRYREDISESLAPFSPYKNDVSVKISNVPSFVEQLDLVLRREYPHWTVVWFGHIGDGNLHINILRPATMTKEDFLKECRRVDQLVFEVVHGHAGSISAEHGLGLTKKDFLHYSKSTEEINYLRDIKKVFDPDGIMNPGKTLP